MKLVNGGSKVARVWLSILVGMIVVLGVGSSPALAADPRAGVFGGNAYGTSANAKVGTLATQLGATGLIGCPCEGTNGQVRFNTVNALTAGNILTSGTIYNTAYGLKTATLARTQQTSEVQGVRLLNGLITARVVRAIATTTAGTSTVQSTYAGSALLDLTIAGLPVNGNVAPNTVIALPGLGSVKLREVIRSGDGVNSSSITVNMLHITINQTNLLGLAVGAEIIVGHASAQYFRSSLQGITKGSAFAALDVINVGPVVNRLGTIAPIGLGCAGTNGRTLENNVNATSVGTTLTSGTGRTTAFGGQTSEGTVARTTATIQQVNLLNGLITADAITAVAKSVKNGTTFSVSTEGSQFVNLRVGGVLVNANVQPNTRINLPGVGYVILYNRTVSTTSRALANVNMILVVVNTANTLGLPVGTQLIVANASSSVNNF